MNNDAQVKIKGPKPFMGEYDRLYMVSILKPVDEAILAIDTDISVCKTIEMIWNRYRDNEMIFAKGGDRFVGNIPEMELCKKLGIKIVDGEFELVDLEEGRGNRAGMATRAILKTAAGTEFEAGMIGSHEYCADLLKNKGEIIGQMVTVVYQNLTPDKGVPRFGKMKTVRWDQ